MKKIISYIAITAASFCSIAQAQQNLPFRNAFGAKYAVNIPLSNTDFIKNTSFVGFELEGKWKVKENLTLGGSIEWASYYQYTPEATYSKPGIDITTDLYRTVYTVPITANIQYYFNSCSAGRLTPYVSAGLGAMYADPTLSFNIYEYHQDTWGFLARPEVGLLFIPNEDTNVGFTLAARYDFATNQSKEFGYTNFQTIGLNLGIFFLGK